MNPSDERVLRLLQDARLALESERKRRTEPIAIVGMGCRFPGGASGPAAFWHLLERGTDATSEVPADRWDAEALYDPDPAVPGKCYLKRGGFLDAIDGFEPEFFGISPREAVGMDPQQRLLLEVAWEALEDAGIPADKLRGSLTGVWIGLSLDDYAARSIGSGDLTRIDPYNALGNARSVAAGRIAYALDLHGPVMQLDAACASSLVTVHLACQSLRAGECDLALAGGVNVISAAEASVALCKLQALAKAGRCKTFDASADGYGRGEGCGIVVLRRLKDARAAGERIHAVIRGTAVNHDGRSNGLTAPNGAAQEAVMRAALANASLDPLSVSYVEAHGTGTILGDPIEVLALNRVYGQDRGQENPLFLGSVKTNFGHLEAAAGVAGLMKTVLALQRRRIPKTLHFTSPNPHISWRELAVTVAAESMEWPSNSTPARAGVSAFGLSGTNAHAVIEETPAVESADVAPARSAELIVLSARTGAALRAAARRLCEYVEAHTELTVGDVAYSLLTTRSIMERRCAFAVASREGLCEGLKAIASEEAGTGAEVVETLGARPKVAFVFPGQGSQWLGMGRQLLGEENAFREAMAACDRAIFTETGWSVVEELQASAEKSRLEQIEVVQPVLFAVEVALATLWRSWGVQPDVVIGHSMGEVAAACVSGSISLEDAVAVVCRRSALLRRIQGQGQMALVELSMTEANAALAGFERQLAVAVSNGRRSTVISGAPGALAQVIARLEARNVFCRRVNVDVASHSPQVDALLEELVRKLDGVSPRPGQVPMRSTVTGAVVMGSELGARYWADNLRKPVSFGQTIEALCAEGFTLFIEMSPHPVLVPAIDEIRREFGTRGAAVGSLRREQAERLTLLQSMGVLCGQGQPLAVKRLFPHRGRRVDLPTYSWQRQRYWIERSSRTVPEGEGVSTNHPLLGARLPGAGADAVYESVWSLDQPSWLREHDIGGQAILPEAALVEITRAAADDWRGDTATNITHLRVESPLIIAERVRQQVRVVVTEGARQIAVYSRDSGGGTIAWTLRAMAKLAGTSAIKPNRLDLSEIRARCREPLHVGSSGRSGGPVNLERGGETRALNRLWKGQDEALAEIELNDAVDGDGYGIHPAILDAGIQAIARAFCALPGDMTWRAVEFKGVELYQTDVTRAFAHACLRATHSTNEVLASLTLADSAGLPVAIIDELRLRGLETKDLRRDDGNAGTRALYQFGWQLADGPAGDAQAPGAGRWVVVALRQPEQSRLLAAELSARGAPCEVVPIDELVDVDAEHVVCFWGHGGIDAGMRLAREGQGVVHALEQWSRVPRLWWVTTGAVDVAPGEEMDPAASALWGLGRTLMQERPDLRCTMVDVGQGTAAMAIMTAAKAILHEVSSGDDEGEIAWRRERRHVARLMRLDVSNSPNSTAPLRIDGTVVIVGKRDAVGLEAARSLARRGVSHVVLMGGPDVDREYLSSTITELEAFGTNVTVATVDVTDREALSQLLSAIPARYPLRGVVLASMDAGPPGEPVEPFAERPSPRLLGALNLHLLTETSDVDRFVVVSSLAGVLGEPRRREVAAVDAFLDGLVARRRARGLAGSHVAVGPRAASTGDMNGVPDLRDRWVDRGIVGLTETEGRRLLDIALNQSGRQIVVAAIDLRRVARTSGKTIPPLWRGLVRPSAIPGAGTRSWAQEIVDLQEDRRLAAVTTAVRAEVARVLALPNAAAVPMNVPLGALGLDSLRAWELRGALARRAGLTLPATMILRGTSAEAIATYLLTVIVRRSDSMVQAISKSVTLCEILNDISRVRVRLFCFPDAVGSSGIFIPFCRLATEGVEVHAISHTREDSSSPARAGQYLREAAAYILGTPRAPVALFGHSLGALFAWRVAEELRALGAVRPILLAVSGSLSPEDAMRKPFPEDMEAAFRVVFGTPSQGRPNLRSDFLADLSLWRAMPIPAHAPLDIPIAAFRTTDDYVVSEANVRRWSRCTTRGFSLTTLPGPHSYLSQERPRDLLLNELAARLAAPSPDESELPEDVPAANG